MTSVRAKWVWNFLRVRSAAVRLLPWPCAAVAAARAGVADRGSWRRLGPPEASASHNILCHGPPCICAGSGGNPPYPAGTRGIHAPGNAVREGARIDDVTFVSSSLIKCLVLKCDQFLNLWHHRSETGHTGHWSQYISVNRWMECEHG